MVVAAKDICERKKFVDFAEHSACVQQEGELCPLLPSMHQSILIA
jgi:hypothetical protein